MYKQKTFGISTNRLDFAKHEPIKIPFLLENQINSYKNFFENKLEKTINEFFPILIPQKNKEFNIKKIYIESNNIDVKTAKLKSKSCANLIYADAVIKTEKNIKVPLEKYDAEEIVKYTKKLLKDTYNIENLDLIDVEEENSIFFLTFNNDKFYKKITQKNEKVEDLKLKKQINKVSLSVKVSHDKNNEEKNVYNFLLNIEIENKIFLTEIPTMSDRGSFIINGVEKVVVFQLLRSPGIYFRKLKSKKNEFDYFSVETIPSLGTWFLYEYTKEINKKLSKKDDLYFNHFINIKIEKTKKISIFHFLKIFGVADDFLIDLFKKNKIFENAFDLIKKVDLIKSIENLFIKIKKSLPIKKSDYIPFTQNFLYNQFFNPKSFIMNEIGRYKLNNKLGVEERLLNKVLANDILLDDKVIFKKNHIFKTNDFFKLKKVFSNKLSCTKKIELDSSLFPGENLIHVVDVYSDTTPDAKLERIVGVLSNTKDLKFTIADFIVGFSYLLNLTDNIGEFDDIDSLINRRVNTVEDLVNNQVKIGLSRVKKNIYDRLLMTDFAVKPVDIYNQTPFMTVINEFFNLSQLCQFLEQTNLLSELTHKRKLTSLGAGGLTKEFAGSDVRDIHFSYYGRICPIETPEGGNIGLINNFSVYSKLDKYNFICTPYKKVVKGVVTDKVEYLSALQEKYFSVAFLNTKLNDKNEIIEDSVLTRYFGKTIFKNKNEVDYIDVSPKQVVSISSSSIPFLENNDGNRALMAANMLRQSIPLLTTNAPIVASGIEQTVAYHSNWLIISDVDGHIKYLDGQKIIVEEEETKKEYIYNLYNFYRSNQNTLIHHYPIVKFGDKVKKGQILADSSSTDNGELALGKNLLCAFITWKGYNYEDAFIVSDRLIKEDVFTSIHIQEYSIEIKKTKLGDECITRDIPNISRKAQKNLDKDGIVLEGAYVKEGDILVGKVTPKNILLTAEDKLLQTIFKEKSKNVKDTSLKMPINESGIVQKVVRLKKEEITNNINLDIIEIVKIFIVQKRKIKVGDKIAGRHGNKGVISKILPAVDMPFLEDGTPVDILINPLSIPSRMNLGQVMESLLGFIGYANKVKFSVPVFEGIKEDNFEKLLAEYKIDDYNKVKLYDGVSGEPVIQKVFVGVMYMLKLYHMVDDKIHARNTGTYSLITQQPLAGKTQNGGQRLGEMEVWSLEAYGAAYVLRELLTIKSDDVKGRVRAYDAIVNNREIPEPSVPESFNVLVRELKGLCLNISFFKAFNREIKEEQVISKNESITEALKKDPISEQEYIGVELDDNDTIRELNIESLFSDVKVDNNEKNNNEVEEESEIFDIDLDVEDDDFAKNLDSLENFEDIEEINTETVEKEFLDYSEKSESQDDSKVNTDNEKGEDNEQ